MHVCNRQSKVYSLVEITVIVLACVNVKLAYQRCVIFPVFLRRLVRLLLVSCLPSLYILQDTGNCCIITVFLDYSDHAFSLFLE